MGFIQDLLSRARQRKEKQRVLEEDDRLLTNVEKKKLTHDERLLIESLREEKEAYLKEALYWDRVKRQIDDRIKSREMMRFNSDLFNNDNILNEKKKFLFGGDF